MSSRVISPGTLALRDLAKTLRFQGGGVGVAGEVGASDDEELDDPDFPGQRITRGQLRARREREAAARESFLSEGELASTGAVSPTPLRPPAGVSQAPAGGIFQWPQPDGLDPFSWPSGGANLTALKTQYPTTVMQDLRPEPTGGSALGPLSSLARTAFNLSPLGTALEAYKTANIDVPIVTPAIEDYIRPALAAGVNRNPAFAPYQLAAEKLGLPSAGDIFATGVPSRAADIALTALPLAPAAVRSARSLAPVLARGTEGAPELAAAVRSIFRAGLPEGGLTETGFGAGLGGGGGVEEILARFRRNPGRVTATELHRAGLEAGIPTARNWSRFNYTKQQMADALAEMITPPNAPARGAGIPHVPEPRYWGAIDRADQMFMAENPGVGWRPGKGYFNLIEDPAYLAERAARRAAARPPFGEEVVPPAAPVAPPPARPPAPPTGPGVRAPEPEGGDPIVKLTRRIKQAAPLPAETETLRHAQRQQRVAAAASEMAQGGTATEQLERGRPLLLQRGEMARATFEAPQDVFSPAEVDTLKQRILDANLPLYQTYTLDGALGKVLGGQLDLLQESELRLLNKVFGPELTRAIQSKQPGGVLQTFIDIAGIPRVLATALDISAPLRQGVWLAPGHPKEWLGGWKPMLRAFVSENAAQQTDDLIRAGKWAEARETAGLYLAPLDTVLTQREEAMISRMAGNLPGVRNAQRAYVTFLNKLRADTFDTYAEKWAKDGMDTPERLRSMAHYVNAASGRGELGPFDQAANALSVVFFAPRFGVSRAQTLGQLLAPGTDNSVRQLAARDMASFMGVGGTLVGLAAATGAAEVELDPRSTDFGKMRVGSQRIDPWGGWQQLVRYTSQIISGQRKASDGLMYKSNRGETLLRFLSSKLSPSGGVALSAFEGKTMVGEPVGLNWNTISREAWNRFVPMWIQDVRDGLAEEGLRGGVLATVSATGVGSQTYVTLNDLSQKRFDVDYGKLDPLRQIEIIRDLERQGKQIENRVRGRPYWTARDEALRVTQEAVVKNAPAGVPVQALEILASAKSYRDFRDALTEDIQRHGYNLAEAQLKVDRYEEALGLTGRISRIRDMVVKADPLIIEALEAEGYNVSERREELVR